jgi:hypothetical protein
MAFLARSSFVITNAEHLAELAEGPRTLCVTGAARGGTSAVALFLREIGVVMGDRIHPKTHEDERLLEVKTDPSAIAPIVAEYNARWPLWGFKLPIGSRMASVFLPLLRSPIMLVVVRNPIATIRGRLSRGMRRAEQQTTFMEMFGRIYADGTRLHDRIAGLSNPVAFIEYEKLLADPRTFATELVDALSLKVDAASLDRAVAAISGPGYKSVERSRAAMSEAAS